MIKKVMWASALAMMLTAPADAAVYSFYNLTNNGNESLTSQLKMEVLEESSSTVSFRFFHDGTIAANITEIYFDDGGFDGLYGPENGNDNPVANVLSLPITISSQGNVSFTAGSASPGNLPSGENAPNFEPTAGFLVDSAPGTGGVLSGQTPEEWVKMIFDYTAGSSLADVIGALLVGELRIGLHVRSIGTVGGSDSYLNVASQDSVTQVPIPAALPLLLSAFGWLGLMGWRRRRDTGNAHI